MAKSKKTVDNSILLDIVQRLARIEAEATGAHFESKKTNGRVTNLEKIVSEHELKIARNSEHANAHRNVNRTVLNAVINTSIGLMFTGIGAGLAIAYNLAFPL